MIYSVEVVSTGFIEDTEVMESWTDKEIRAFKRGNEKTIERFNEEAAWIVKSNPDDEDHFVQKASGIYGR